MKSLLLLLLCSTSAFAAMICAIATPAGESLPKPRADQIEFSIAFDSLFKTTKSGDTLWSEKVIYCSWKNISSQPVPITLKDHDRYSGTLDYVFGTQIRISDSRGRILTATAQNQDGWWDSARQSSSFSALMPGDIISLRPGETVIRTFKIEDILRGLLFTQAAEKAPTLPDGSRDMTKWDGAEFSFPFGESKIEVRLWDLVANRGLVFQGRL